MENKYYRKYPITVIQNKIRMVFGNGIHTQDPRFLVTATAKAMHEFNGRFETLDREDLILWYNTNYQSMRSLMTDSGFDPDSMQKEGRSLSRYPLPLFIFDFPVLTILDYFMLRIYILERYLDGIISSEDLC